MSENGKKREGRWRAWLLLAGGALGLLLLLLGGMGEKERTETVSAFRYENLDPSDYAKEVEERVATLCSQVSGAGKSFAVVTLGGGYRAVFATDSQSGSSGQKDQVVLIGSGSAETAVLLGYENPVIEGIGIVCEGGDDPRVQREIISLVSAAYHIGASRIYVVRGSPVR